MHEGGRPRLTLETDPDRSTLLEIAKSIAEGKFPEKGYAAAKAFAGPPEEGSSDANLARLYRKYKKYQQELKNSIQARSSQLLEGVNVERIIAEALAGQDLSAKVGLISRYLTVIRDSSDVFQGVVRKFQRSGKPLAIDELKKLAEIVFLLVDAELRESGIVEELRETSQKLFDSGHFLMETQADEDGGEIV